MVTVFEPVEAAILRYSKKNGVNENFSKFTGNTCARVLEAEPATLFERDSGTGVSDFCEIFNNTFLKKNPWKIASEPKYPEAYLGLGKTSTVERFFYFRFFSIADV